MNNYFKILYISTHTLARRVTGSVRIMSTLSSDFNPHPRTEGDSAFSAYRSDSSDFNPHPRTEGDFDLPVFFDQEYISTHTLARRVTIGSNIILSPTVDFNPHPRTEGDFVRVAV